jgi:hypothetical protein
MHDAQHLDGVASYAVRHKIRRSGYDEFACSYPAANATALRKGD